MRAISGRYGLLCQYHGGRVDGDITIPPQQSDHHLVTGQVVQWESDCTT